MRKKNDAPKSKDGARKPRKLWRLLLLIAAILLPSLLWAVSPLRDRLEQQKQMAEYEQKLKAMNAANAQVKKEIEGLKNDEYIELKARQDLGLVKPGEELYIVNGLETTQSAQKNKAKKAKPALSPWKRALSFLGLK